MAVSARPVKDSTESANLGVVDMRGGSAVSGGSYVYEGARLVTPRHHHDLHQIEYAVHGVVEVRTEDGQYLLPPHQAAWIPAGCDHTTTLNREVRTVAVLFAPELVASAGTRVRIIAVPPLLREMILHAVRWPITRPRSDEVADAFFRTLGHLVGEALDHERPLSLPTTSDPVVGAAIEYTHEHLAEITVTAVARHAGVSVRTLRRRFDQTIGMSWRGYLVQARIMRAMALLSEPSRSLLDVAVTVGFDGTSAFARAFTRQCGETPAAYRRRITVRAG